MKLPIHEHSHKKNNFKLVPNNTKHEKTLNKI